MTSTEVEPFFAAPVGLSRDPYWDDAWTDKRTNQYVLPHPDNEFEALRAGRASELGKAISNTFTLNRWHKEMVLTGAVLRPSIILRAFTAMNDGLSRKQLSRVKRDLCTEAEDVAGTKEPAAVGTGFHKVTELWDANRITVEATPPPWDRDVLAYAEILMRTGIVCVPEFTERIVFNRRLNTVGRFDRLWRYLRCCQKWHVGDLKTGRYLDYGWLEIVVQLFVYATADLMFYARADSKKPTIGADPAAAVWGPAISFGGDVWAPMPEVCDRTGLVLHVPADGKKYLEGDIMASGEVAEGGEPTGDRMAALYEVDLTKRIELPSLSVSPADLAVGVQEWHKTKKVAGLVARVEVTADGEVVDSPLTVRERIEMAGSESELAALREDALARREWNGWHTRWAKERLATLASKG